MRSETKPVIPSDLPHYPAPAKLNLDLRIIGRRSDGYHLLESIFTLIDLQDTLAIVPRKDSKIILHTPTAGVAPEQDLTVRAGHALQQYSQCTQGADIWLNKRIPMGGGLGGGSSNAATVLMVLNHLWQTQLSTPQLIQLGATLGADVPFFLFQRNAFAQGIGEQLEEISIPKQWHIVVRPDVSISTAKIFQHPLLTRNSKPSIMPTFHDLQPFRNDMQAIVLQEYPIVARIFEELQSHGTAQLTGSGSCLFLSYQEQAEANEVFTKIQQKYTCFLAQGLDKHPLTF